MTILLTVITLLALIFGAILGFASLKLKVEADPIVEKIDAILPQSQCGQCGYPGCKPYAEAICNGDEITKCVPGGRETVVKISEILGVDIPSVDGMEEPVEMVAFIDEICVSVAQNVFRPVR
ncbi:electron transport complex protein RnfB [Rodentibacter pneumotropicus]|uniref:Ion-translocating oxidoreductase complex subunit B n=1 Tax=Rodentibacter pneumotropicus TaxID=758 RepID=A0A3S4W2H4_9PAST|nr:electron transport complex protein RnfB [Rodentibacter pneumotropicus]